MTDKIAGTPEIWEEGPLGKEAEFAEALSPELQAADEDIINEALGLKPISIRMEIEILDNLKAIAKHRNIGYQPLIRQILHRWVDCELKQIALEAIDKDKDLEIQVGCQAGQDHLQKKAA